METSAISKQALPSPLIAPALSLLARFDFLFDKLDYVFIF